MGDHIEVSSCDKEKGPDEDGDADGQRIAETFSQYQVRGTQATVTIRQLRSEGLSFQLWPAANATCLYIEKEFGERGMFVIDVRPPHLQQDVARWYSSYAVLERTPVLIDSFSKGLEKDIVRDDSLERNGRQWIDSYGRRAATVVQDIERPFASIDINNRMDPAFTNLVLDHNICTVGLCNKYERNGRMTTDSKDRPDAQILRERTFANEDIGIKIDPGYTNFEANHEQEIDHSERNEAHVVNEFEAPLYLGTDFSNIHFPMRRMRVLELGSGTGMVGIVAACLGADVVLTDLPHVIPNISYNLDLNRCAVEAAGGSVEARVLRWGVEEDVKALGGIIFDLILASDCVYQDTSYKPLLQTVNWLMALDTEHTNVTTEQQKSRIPKGVSSALPIPLHETELLPSELLGPAVCLSPLSKRLMPVADEIDLQVNNCLEQPASRIEKGIENGRRSVSNKPEQGLDTKDRGKRRGSNECVLLLGHVRRWKKDSHFFRMAAKRFDVEVVYRHPPEENDRIGPIVYRLSAKSNRTTSSVRSRSSSASITSLLSCSPSRT